MIRKAALALSSLAFAGLLALSPARAEAQQTITCSSRDYERTYCNVNTSGGVRLVRQLSDADCVSGRTWGTDRRGLWVSRGCRAQFSVGRYDNRGRSDNRGRYDDRGRWDDRNNSQGRAQAFANQFERVCRNAVAQQYRNVRGSDVEAIYRAQDRSGNHLVRWGVNRTTGTCTITPQGRVIDLNVSRR